MATPPDVGTRFAVIHGHFYQPPRENPWIEEIEVQDTAAPYHDWNERIHAECYGPNSASRVVAQAGGIIDIRNNYEHLSFNIGPTLAAWLARKAASTFGRIVAADHKTHGAIAQAYSHPILPLSSRRDKRTQVRWGIADFRTRFGRDPAGMWLPECAVDGETLEVLVEEGIRFTILAPGSCAGFRAPGGELSRSGVDPRRAYKVELPGGRAIAVFFYDGVVAQKIAFGDALANRDALVGALAGAFDADPARGPQLVNVATDGETFGHHRAFGDMVLAAALERIERERPFQLTSYADYLERFPPEFSAEIVAPSSWSCGHGVERWRSDCGCTTPTQPGWHQKWRRPLREAMDELCAELGLIYEREAGEWLRDPWAARDDYIQVILNRSHEQVAEFMSRHGKRPLDSAPERSRVLKLCESARQALLMQTSCGWFFDELSRPEGVQVLRYAMRAVQLAREVSGVDLEPRLYARLREAPSNTHGDGAQILDQLVRPAVTGLHGVLAHYAISSLYEEYPREGTLYSYRFTTFDAARRSRGAAQLAVGRVSIESQITQEVMAASFGLIHFGGHDFRCAVGGPHDLPEYSQVQKRLITAFEDGSLTDVVRALDQLFPGRQYGLGDLFRDGRRKVLKVLLQDVLLRYQERYDRIFDENRALLRFLARHEIPAPPALRVAAELTLGHRIVDGVAGLSAGESFLQLRESLRELAAEARTLGLKLQLAEARPILGARVLEAVEALRAHRASALEVAAAVAGFLDVARELAVEPPLWPAQNQWWGFLQDAAKDRVAADDERDAIARLSERLGFDRGVLSFLTPAARASG
jgi:alpha-amylase/alpha-mannosidase (GH57 family)